MKSEKERGNFSLGVRLSKILYQTRNLHGRKPRGYFFRNFLKIFFCVIFFTSPYKVWEREREKFLLGVRWSKIWYQIRNLHGRKPRVDFFHNFVKINILLHIYTPLGDLEREKWKKNRVEKKTLKKTTSIKKQLK